MGALVAVAPGLDHACHDYAAYTLFFSRAPPITHIEGLFVDMCPNVDERCANPKLISSDDARGGSGWMTFRLDRRGFMRSIHGRGSEALAWAHGRPLTEIAGAESLRQAKKRLVATKPDEPAASADLELFSPDETRHVLEVVVLGRGRPGEDVLIRGVMRDVTHEREIQSAFRTLGQDSPIGIYIVQNGRFAYANPSMGLLTGYCPEQLVGMRSAALVHEEDRDLVRSSAIAMLKGCRTAPYDYRSIYADGSVHWVLETVSSVGWLGRRAVLGNYMDYSAQKELESRLRDATLHDPLTGVPNRVFLLQRLDELLQRPGAPVGLLFCDLDGFKAVNDEHGHAAGDRLLRAFASRLAGVVRHDDLVARVGGDEFVVLVTPPFDECALKSVSERALATVSRPFRLGDLEATVGLSIGVAVGKGGVDSSASLLERADRTMYRAKLAGKARVAICESDFRDVA